MCKRKFKYNLYTLKNDLFGCFRIEEIRDKDNETCLKEGGGIKRCPNIFYWVKNDLFGCFAIEENVTKTMKHV